MVEPNVTIVVATVTSLLEKDGKVIGVEYRPNTSKEGNGEAKEQASTFTDREVDLTRVGLLT